MKILLAIMLFTGIALAQGGNTLIIRFAGAPTGSCSPFMLGINNVTGEQYDCLSGSWNLVGGGGGGSAFSAITSGTNTTAAMVVGSGASLVPSGTGTITPTSSTGPVINVTDPTYGASSSLADNNTAFTAAFAAASALSTKGTGIPSVKNVAQTVPTSAVTSFQITIAIVPGDTVLVFPTQIISGRTVTVTDTGGNVYRQLAPSVATGTSVVLWGTAPSGATAAASSITVTMSGAASPLGGFAITFGNVGQYRFVSSATGSSVTPAQTQTTIAANDMLVSAAVWYNNATISAAQNTGTLQLNYTGTTAIGGGALITQSQATVGTSTTNNVTLSATSPWSITGLELSGLSLVWPTVYIPQGTGQYNYSGGISMTRPMTLKCEPGTWLYYTGSAHAVDVGATGLGFGNMQRRFVIDGCVFTGGQNYTQGVFFNSYVEMVGIRNSTFYNFGNSTGYMVAGNGENWDMEIGPQVGFITDDFQPRNIFTMNLAHTSQNSYVRVHDVDAACLAGYQNLGCSATQTGIGFIIDGSASRVYHNNIAFFNPDIRLICSNSPCSGTNIEGNQLEPPGSGTTKGVVEFSGSIDSVLVSGNYANMHDEGSFITPLGGTDLMTGWRVAFNKITNIPAATPLVAQLNLANQTGNYSWQNTCADGAATSLPCALLHTAGGNIASWNSDYAGQCTMNGSTGCPVYSFSQTYATAPRCTATWNGTGALIGSIKAATSTTQLTITSSTAADTAVVNWTCSVDSY